MIVFDASQQQVCALDPARHARVVGAPGSGKSLLVTESYARLVLNHGYRDDELLCIAPERLAGARLRRQLERRLHRAIGGTPVRTIASFAFAILAAEAATAGAPAPRLLTGTAHDDAIARAVQSRLHTGDPSHSALTDEFGADILLSERFRAELRELWRVLDEGDLSPRDAEILLRSAVERDAREAVSRTPAPEFVGRWVAVLGLVDEVQQTLQRERPHEYTSSGLLRAATALVRANELRFSLPQLIIVDDAQQLREGELALLAACASRGTKLWVFGDPDVTAGAFQGEATAVLSRLSDELARRGVRAQPGAGPEQVVVLERVYRHGHEIRRLVAGLTERLGTAGVGAQRLAVAAASSRGSRPPVTFARCGSVAEQWGALAHRLRARHLGVDGGDRVPWGEMAVICRSRSEVVRASRLLAERQIPTGVRAGGFVLREQRIVRELVLLLRHALGIAPVNAQSLGELLGGDIGGLDALAIRRLRRAVLVHERRQARMLDRAPMAVDEVMLEAFCFAAEHPIIDSAGGRALRRLGRIAAAAQQTHEAGATARETLWAIWEATGLATQWQDVALGALGARAESANRALDAVMGLFFRLQRHEEQNSDQPIAELLNEMLASDVPEDTLAARSARDEVLVTTAQGAIGLEREIVAVVGPQEGVWPNLRAQGSLLAVGPLERWLLGGAAMQASRRETLHDELRLFALACSRARSELLVLSIDDDQHLPGPFFGLGRAYELSEALPSSRVTLRGAVAEMRRRLTLDPGDRVARDSLVALARAQVPGAHPAEWYGVMPASTEAPLVDLAANSDATVPVGPSELERAEDCPLNWAIHHLGGGTGGVSASLGTLMHYAFQSAENIEYALGDDAETRTTQLAAALCDVIASEWGKLRFDADWERTRTLNSAQLMAEGLARYVVACADSGASLIASEAGFGVQLGRAVLRGVADRLEQAVGPEGEPVLSIVDLKTGTQPPTGSETQAHAQLRAYQLGLVLGGFTSVDSLASVETWSNGGARLLFVHPKATKSRPYLELRQAPLECEAQQDIEQRVSDIAWVMAAGEFVARLEHHCTNEYVHGQCQLHIVPAVSHA